MSRFLHLVREAQQEQWCTLPLCTKSFSGSFRDKCLNSHWFLSLEDAREKIENRRVEYIEFSPNSSLENLTPAELGGRKFLCLTDLD